MLKCDHCLLEFPEREAVYGEIDSMKKTFCCNGCRGIYGLIHEEGLDEFYEKRIWKDSGISTSQLTGEIDIKPFTERVVDIEDRTQKTEDMAQSTGHRQQKEIDIFIEGVRCASCIWLNEKILSRLNGVDYVKVSYATHKAKIRWQPELVGLEKILKRIISIGYIPKPYSESERFKAQRAEARDLLLRFGTAGFLSSQLMLFSIALYAGYFQGIEQHDKFLFESIAMLITIPVIFYSGMPFIKGTVSGLRNLRFNMDSLITIGAGSAFLYSVYQMRTGGKVYFDTSAMIITLILLGRYIEVNAKGKASEAIEKLSGLTPKEARLLAGSQESVVRERKIVPLDSVKKGELIEVIPGEKVPLDGTVISGESEVDESLITGESRPVMKTSGSRVIGGSMNLYGTLVFEVTATGKETVLSGIIKAVEDAQNKKPHIQRLADRIVGVFVPAVLIISALTVAFYLLNGAPAQLALMTGISVLVIACPCSLGLATPLSVMMFTTMASSKGVLIKGGDVIENASRLTGVIFDKTGTITIGRPVLKEVVVVDKNVNKEHVISFAASIERLSEHSIGHAITEAAKGLEQFNVSEFRATTGKGVEGTVDSKRIFIGNRIFMNENNSGTASLNEDILQFERNGDTVVYMAWDKTVRAVFIISDIIRSEALEAIDKLKGMKLETFIISGDNKTTTDSIASAVGVNNAISEALPVKKKDVIENIQNRGGRVLMAGDGINDAPALTEASVGMAMGRGTDIAMESADAVLVRNDLKLIPYFIGLSKRTYSIIKQNIFWSFFYNVVAIPLAVLGVLHPIVAAGAMAASSLFVVGNSLRIRRIAA